MQIKKYYKNFELLDILNDLEGKYASYNLSILLKFKKCSNSLQW